MLHKMYRLVEVIIGIPILHFILCLRFWYLSIDSIPQDYQIAEVKAGE